MTVIQLDANTLAQFQAAEGSVILADEHGKAIRICVLPKVPTEEPNLTPEEWEARARKPGGLKTSQVLEFLQNLDRK